MMEQQIEKVRGETKAVQESVGRAREVIEGLEKEEKTQDLDTGRVREVPKEERKRKRRQGEEIRVWEVLEREVGRI